MKTKYTIKTDFEMPPVQRKTHEGFQAFCDNLNKQVLSAFSLPCATGAILNHIERTTITEDVGHWSGGQISIADLERAHRIFGHRISSFSTPLRELLAANKRATCNLKALGIKAQPQTKTIKLESCLLLACLQMRRFKYKCQTSLKTCTGK